MKSKGAILRKLVQSSLPHAQVFWDPPPDDSVANKTCELIAVNRNNPEKRGSIIYLNGFPTHPIKIETLADEFVTYVGPDISDH